MQHPVIHINIRVCISNGIGNSKQDLQLFALACSAVSVIAFSVALYLLFAADPMDADLIVTRLNQVRADNISLAVTTPSILKNKTQTFDRSLTMDHGSSIEKLL